MKIKSIFILTVLLSGCVSNNEFDQNIWFLHKTVEGNERLKMVNDIIDNHLSFGESIDNTMLTLGKPTKRATDLVTKDQIEDFRSNIMQVLNSSGLSQEEKISILENWFDQSSLIQETLLYRLGWTNGEEPYPVYLQIVFVENKLVSKQILLDE